MNRPIVAVNLPAAELAAVTAELRAAGYPIAPIDDVADLEALLGQHAVLSAAILDAEADPDRAVALRSALRASPNPVPVIFVVSDETLDMLVDAGALGPEDEVLIRPYAPDSARWRVEAVRIRSEAPSGAAPSDAVVLTSGGPMPDWDTPAPIVVVFSAKGGVGKTTIATNLAAAAQMKHGKRVLLIDGDTVSGHISTSLALEDVRTVSDAWIDAGDGHRPSILEVASGHVSGMRVAALASDPLSSDTVLDSERVVAALAEARRGVDLVVVDLHPFYGELNLAILAMADRILVPVTPDIPAIRAAVQLTEVASRLGVRDRLAMVVNRANSGVAVADMERTVGMEALALIRSGGLLITRAANEGRTVIDMSPREKISADFQMLAERVLGPIEAQAAPASRDTRATKGRPVMGGIFGRREAIRREPARV